MRSIITLALFATLVVFFISEAGVNIFNRLEEADLQEWVGNLLDAEPIEKSDTNDENQAKVTQSPYATFLGDWYHIEGNSSFSIIDQSGRPVIIWGDSFALASMKEAGVIEADCEQSGFQLNFFSSPAQDKVLCDFSSVLIEENVMLVEGKGRFKRR
jgi:hypothetical protein